MKELLVQWGTMLFKLLTTAINNAINNPRTTTAGIIAIGAGVTALSNGPLTSGDVATAIVSIIGGVGAILADDPTKKSENVKDE